MNTARKDRHRTREETDARRAAGYSREAILIVCLALLAALFAVTAGVSRLYHKKVHQLGDAWFAKGEAAFRSGNSAAVADYRNALVYSPNNALFQLHLAQALAASGGGDEARSYLINLLMGSPGSGEINLELARIDAREGDSQEAIRYYHSAIYGVWENDPLLMRWRVRRELCEYLLDHGHANGAQPDVIALAQEAPPGDLDRQRESAEFLLRAGLQARALDEFRSVLTANSQDADALVGAGAAAFQLAQYSEALKFFNKIPRERKLSPDIEGMLTTARQVETANPFAPGLSTAEKAKRTADAIARVQSRAAGCVLEHERVPSETQGLAGLQETLATFTQNKRTWSEENLRRRPSQINAAMSAVFAAEDATTLICGQPQEEQDRTLLLLSRSRANGSR